ncbi:Mechanosensitive ion channel-domain-containing protein [Cytidiella melzeri]|nr:Mechanosensitive ion channel-domain-containing protein [Cytidiella melzeri]
MPTDHSNGKESTPEEIQLPKLTSPKVHDYAASKKTADLPDVDRDRLTNVTQIENDDNASDLFTDSEDEFDWEAEDDDLSTHHKDLPTRSIRGRAVWLAFMKLSRTLRTLLVGVLGVGILITPLLVFQLRFNSSPARRQAHVWSLWLTITWAAACATYLAVDLAPALASGIFRLFSHSFERIKITIELTAAVRGWLKLALDVTWAWIALSVIRVIYNPPGNYWIIVNRVMQALFSASILLLVEKVFLRYVAINFHRRALADRLEENQLGLRALDRLSNATPNLAARRHPYGHATKKGHRSSAVMEAHASSSSSSPINEKAESPIGDKGTIARKTHRTRFKQRSTVAAVIVENLGLIKNQRQGNTLYSASKLARKLFSTLSAVYPPRDHLLVEDFYPYFKSKADAQAAFAVFDKDGNGDITKKEMRDAVRRIYHERRALTASLKDVGSAVAKLDAVLLAVALLIFIFICLLIFNKNDTLQSLVPLASIVLGFSFIFGHSAQTLFESLIFIFSTHVFDVGDLVMIDDSPMFVREFGLFSTTFRRVDGQEVIAPNSLLSGSKLVHNLRRSNSMWETTPLKIAYDTPLKDIELLRRRLEEYVQNEENRRQWSNVLVNIDKMEFQNAIDLVIAMEHKPNWQDWGGRWTRRNKFMRYFKTVLEEIGISYTMPIQPVLLPNPPPGYGGGGGLGSPYPRSPRSPRAQFPLSDSASGEGVGLGMQFDASRESLGNAGGFRGGEMGRAPTRSLRPGPDRF